MLLELHRNKEERKSCPIIALGQLFHSQASWGGTIEEKLNDGYTIRDEIALF